MINSFQIMFGNHSDILGSCDLDPFACDPKINVGHLHVIANKYVKYKDFVETLWSTDGLTDQSTDRKADFCNKFNILNLVCKCDLDWPLSEEPDSYVQHVVKESVKDIYIWSVLNQSRNDRIGDQTRTENHFNDQFSLKSMYLILWGTLSLNALHIQLAFYHQLIIKDRTQVGKEEWTVYPVCIYYHHHVWLTLSNICIGIDTAASFTD
jgi:hypothetical protein